MPSHSSLTGADLHESKGTDTASADTVFVADGAGSGSYQKVPADAIDTSTILNLNEYYLSIKITDLPTASNVYLPVMEDATLINAWSVISGAISGADTNLNFTRNGSDAIGTITIAHSGSATGDLDTIGSLANNAFTAPAYLKIACDGGASGGTSDAYLVLQFRLD